MMRLAKEEPRKEIMKKKSNLKGRKEIVSEDWTWEERKMRWKIGEVARKGRGQKDRYGQDMGR